MGLDTSFFQPGENPLLNMLELRPDLSATQLGGFVLVLAVLLGHCAYTDIFCGRVIRNSTTMATALVCLAITPLVLTEESLRVHALSVVIVIVLLTFIYFLGAFKEGDLKIYAALALFLGPATVVFVFASFAVIILYSLRAAVATQMRRLRDRRHGSVKPFHEYRTYVPAGPGIALALPVTMILADIEPGYAFLIVGAQIAVVALLLQGSYIGRKADELEAETAREAAREAARESGPVPASDSNSGAVRELGSASARRKASSSTSAVNGLSARGDAEHPSATLADGRLPRRLSTALLLLAAASGIGRGLRGR